MTPGSPIHPGESNANPEMQHRGSGGCELIVWESPGFVGCSGLEDMAILAEFQPGLQAGRHVKLTRDFRSRHTFGCQHNTALLLDI